jgi:hypothetical protein
MGARFTQSSVLFTLAAALAGCWHASPHDGASAPDGEVESDTDADSDTGEDTGTDQPTEPDTGEDTDPDTSIDTGTGPPEEVCIDFDESPQPCAFMNAQALRDEYEDLGVVFSGDGPDDGGAVLDECGGFGVTGHSSPNFLAFNCDTELSDDGIPCPPEIIEFATPKSQVRFSAGSDVTGELFITAYDSTDEIVDFQTLEIESEMSEAQISGADITEVIIEVENTTPPPGCVPSDDPGCDGCDCEVCVCAELVECCWMEWSWSCVLQCAECGESCWWPVFAVDDLCFH